MHFKVHKRVRNSLEEESVEECHEKRKCIVAIYKLNHMNFKNLGRQTVEGRNKIYIIKRKFDSRKCEKLSNLRTQSGSKEMRVTSIITDGEIVETGIIRYVLPSFRPLHTDCFQIPTCKNWKFQFREEIPYRFNDIFDNQESLVNYAPNLTQYIIGDGNCYFSTISKLITGSQVFYAEFRKIIIDNMLGDLA